MRRDQFLALAALAGLILVACGGSATTAGSKPPYVLYAEADITGPFSSIGQPLLSAIKGYTDYVNAHGGVRGHKVVVTALDDAGDPGRVRADVQQAVSGHALAIVGANSSNAWSPNALFIQQNQIPTIGLGFTDPQLESPNDAYLYGLSPPYADYVKLQVDQIKNSLIKNGSVPARPRVAFYHYASAAISTMLTYQHRSIEQNGWTFTTDQSFNVAPTDVSSQAEAVAASKPDVVLAELVDTNAPLAVRTLREKGYKGPIVNYSAASSPATFSTLKDPAYYGQVHFLNATWNDQPGVAEIARRARSVKETDSLDSGFYTFGWAATAAVVAGLDKCADPCTAVKLNRALDALGKVDVNGVNPNAGYSSSYHHLAGAGIYYHWDTKKNAPQPIGGWMRVG